MIIDVIDTFRNTPAFNQEFAVKIQIQTSTGFNYQSKIQSQSCLRI